MHKVILQYVSLRLTNIIRMNLLMSGSFLRNSIAISSILLPVASGTEWVIAEFILTFLMMELPMTRVVT